MEKVPSCSYDSFDAIYQCNDCQLMLCPKHLFSHKNELSDHDIKHLKFPVFNESKEILYKFLIKMKQKCSLYHNQQLGLMSNDEYLFTAFSINNCFTIIDKMLLFLINVKNIPMTIIFRPLDYFLIHPPDKAQKYANDFQFPEKFNKSCFETITDYLVSFNYYRYEGHNYIHGSQYNDVCGDIHWHIGLKKAIEFIRMCEYETANEILQNIYSNREFCPMYIGLWNVTKLLIEMTFMLIKEKNPDKITLMWDLWDESDIQYDDPAYIIAYEVVSSIYESLNCQKEMFTFLRYALKTSRIYKEREFLNIIRLNFILGLKYWYYKRNLFKAVACINESIELSKAIKNTNDVLLYYKCLCFIYIDLEQEDKINEILSEIQSNEFHFEDKILLNYVMGYLYYLISDFDKAETMLWKCVKDAKLSGKEKYHHLLDTYLQLSDIYHHKGDLIKEGQMIFNAKSCCSILPLSNYDIQDIYIKSANYYQRQCRYEDSLHCLESIEKYCNWPIVKYWIGVAHFNMWNNDIALEIFSEIKKSGNPHIKKVNLIVCLDTLIGKLYERKGNYDSADDYFMEAFQTINNNNNKNVYFDSFDIIFHYFYEKCDYEKCKNILKKQWKFIKKYPNRKSQLNNHLIRRAQLHISQNRLENAKRWINKLENSLNLNELFYQTRKTFDVNNLSVLINMAEVYIQISDFVNAKKILKYCEKFVDKYLRCDLISKINIYRLFGELYFYTKRWKKVKYFYQKWLSMLHQYKCYEPKILEFIKNRLAILRLY